MTTLPMQSPTLPGDPEIRARSFRGPADTAREAAAYAAIQSPGIGETAWAAFEGTIPALVGNQIARQGFFPDPNYEIDDALWKGLTDGIHPDLWTKYKYTVSRDHANSLLVENRLEMERRQILGNAGVGGQAANIVAGITDPAMFLATVGTAGLAGSMRLATAAGRVGSLIEGGLTAGVPMVALESYRASQDPSVRTGDIVAAGFGGFGLGSVAVGTRNASRFTRFYAAGAAQALPPALVNSTMEDAEHRNAWSALAVNFVLGGVGNAVHANRKPAQAAMAADLEAVARNAAKDFQVAEAHDAARAAGVIPEPTPKDVEAFKSQIDPKTVQARGEATVGEIVRGHNEDAAALGMTQRLRKEFANEYGDATETTTAATPEPAPKPTPAPAPPPKKSTKGFFTKADIEARLVRTYMEQATGANVEHADMIAAMGGKGWGAEDIAYEIGDDAAEIAMLGTAKTPHPRSNLHGRMLDAAKEAARSHPDPQMQFLAAIHDNLPHDRVTKTVKGKKKSVPAPLPPKELHTPTEIETGAEFTINGERFRVEASADGQYRMLTDGGNIPDVPLEALDAVPVDKGSMTQGEVVVHPGDDPTDYSLPRDETGSVIYGEDRLPPDEVAAENAEATTFAPTQRDLLGRPIAEPATGAQRGFAFATEGSTPSQFTRSGDATDAKIAAQYSPDATNKLFGLGAASPDSIALPIAERNYVEDLDLTNIALEPAKASKTHYIQVGGSRLPINTWGSFGMSEFLGSSDSTAMRRFSKAFGHDPIPDASGAPVIHSAPLWASERSGIKTAEDHARFSEAFRKYASRMESTGAKAMSVDEFAQQVTFAKRRMGSKTFQQFEPEVQAAAKDWVKPVDELLGLQERHNVPASEVVPEDQRYVANIWNRSKIDEWRVRDEPAIRELFEKYAEGDNLGLANSSLKKNIAQAFLDHAGANSHDPLAFQKIQADPEVLFERLVKQSPVFNTPEVLAQLKSQMRAGVEIRLERELKGRKIGQHNIGAVLTIARDLRFRSNYIRAALERLKWDPNLIDNALDAVKKAADENKNPAHLRRRFMGNIEAEIVTRDGTKLRIEDFLINDARVVSHVMNRRAYGAAAFHGAMRALTPEHAVPPRTIAEALRALDTQMQADGIADAVRAQELRYAETLMKHAAGVPLFENTWATRTMRTIMNAQSFLRMSNARVGFQNGLEINRTIARHGMRATMEQMPALKEIWKQAESGRLDNKLLREMRTLVGQDFDAGIRKNLLDSDEVGRTPQSKAERLAARGANVSGRISGTNAATEFAVRGTEAIIAQRLVDIARSGKLPSKYRLASGGLHDWQAERLMKAIKSEIEAGTIEMDGNRVVAFNYERWADQEATSWLRNFAALETRNLIQRGDASTYAQWMTRPMGDLLIQFRKWGIFAHRNHLLYNLNAADTQAVRETVTAFAFGALVHMVAVAEAMILLDAAERDKYLEKRMSAEGIAIGAFARSGWSAMMPAYWDAARSVAGREPTFAYVRASGLSDGGGLLSNPTVAWLNSAANLATRTPQALFMDDRQLSQNDVRNFTNTFVPNIFGLKRGIEALLGSDLPEGSTVR